MSRRSKPERRIPAADPIYNNVDVSKFINRIMRRGKKSLAEKIFYATLQKIEERTNEKALEIFQSFFCALLRVFLKQNFYHRHCGIKPFIERFDRRGIFINEYIGKLQRNTVQIFKFPCFRTHKLVFFVHKIPFLSQIVNIF